MALFSKKSPPAVRPSLSRPSFGRDYLVGILASVGAEPTEANLINLAERSAMNLGGQGAAYMAQARDGAAFARFVEDFSRPPANWLDVVDEMAEWLWNWNPFCHEALGEQSGKWARGCASPGGFVSAAGVQPWENGKNRAPADNVELWKVVYARNSTR
jgi:hypothetical protein